MSDETRARLLSTVLWLLVILALAGGLAGCLRGRPPSPATPATGVAEFPAGEAWAAAGLGARFVEVYLAGGDDQAQRLGEFLGYVPDLPPGAQRAVGGPAPVPVGVEWLGESYWAVTVAAGPEYWRVGVNASAGRLVATGLPTPTPGPRVGERAALAVTLSSPPVGAVEVEAVAGFAAAYLCGGGDVARYLAPGADVQAVSPAVCGSLEVTRWGSRPVAGDHLEVVAELRLVQAAGARAVTLALVLGERDGRWEIAEVLPAPPLASNEKETTS